MKVMQYTTVGDVHLRPFEMKPMGTEMSGILTLRLSGKKRREEILGFGVALTGSSCYHLNRMNPESRHAFLKEIYGRDGLRLSVGRLSVGSSDYSAELYSYDDVQDDTSLSHFSVARDEAYILPMIREVLRIRKDLFLLASPWSPPGWMKSGGSLCGGFMRDRYVDCYADYIVKFLKAYREHGVPVRAVTPQNEPEAGTKGKYASAIWSPDTEAEFILALKHQLLAAGLDTEIWMFDHNFDGWHRVAWQLKEYPKLLENTHSVAFHYYLHAVEQIERLRELYPGLEFHFTEGGPRLYDHYATDFCKWGIMIARAMNHGMRSFCGWNLMLDELGGPNLGPHACGGLVTRNSASGELTFSGQYKALGHFSRFVDPGARVLESEMLGDGQCMFRYPDMGLPTEACVLQNPDGGTVMVVTNPNAEKRQVQVFYRGSWWYCEMLPESVSTLVFPGGEEQKA